MTQQINRKTLSPEQERYLKLSGEALDNGDEILANSYWRLANLGEDNRKP